MQDNLDVHRILVTRTATAEAHVLRYNGTFRILDWAGATWRNVFISEDTLLFS